jgi:hypothetical protein
MRNQATDVASPATRAMKSLPKKNDRKYKSSNKTAKTDAHVSQKRSIDTGCSLSYELFFRMQAASLLVKIIWALQISGWLTTSVLGSNRKISERAPGRRKADYNKVGGPERDVRSDIVGVSLRICEMGDAGSATDTKPSRELGVMLVLKDIEAFVDRGRPGRSHAS